MRAFVVVVLATAVAGCFDFSRLGDADLSAAADMTVPIGASCQSRRDCATGVNCIAGTCLPARADCAALKAAFPGLADGVYWLQGDTGTSKLAYCDLQLGAALCEEGPAAHAGRTREGSKLGYTAMTVLAEDARSCELWAVRGVDGKPMAPLHAIDGLTLDTCHALGFAGDVMLGSCNWGADKSSCGFDAGWVWYGNLCNGCDMNPGTYPRWVPQGTIHNGHIMSSADRSTVTRCRTE
jgi:hypothetical protein